MKKRTFYVVNLDKSRILVIGLLFLGFVLTAYATGYRVGQKPVADLERPRDREPLSMPDSGDSIYSKREDEPRQKTEESSSERSDKLDRKADDRVDLSNRFPEKPKPGKLPVMREPRKIEDRPVAKSTPIKKKDRPAKTEKIEKTEKKETAKAKTSETKEISKPAAKDPVKKEIPEEKKETAKKPEKSEKSDKVEARNPRSALLDSKETKLSNVSETDKKTAETPKTSAKTHETSAKRFTLQVGSFQTKAAAERMLDSLKHQGFDARLQASQGNFAVRVGRPGKPADLEKMESNLKKKNYAPVRVAVAGE